MTPDLAARVAAALDARKSAQAAGPRTVADLARILGVERSDLRKRLAGERPMPPEMAARIREILPEINGGETRIIVGAELMGRFVEAMVPFPDLGIPVGQIGSIVAVGVSADTIVPMISARFNIGCDRRYVELPASAIGSALRLLPEVEWMPIAITMERGK